MTLKARYKLNGTDTNITPNIEALNMEYYKNKSDTLSNVDVFYSSNYMVMLQSGYIYVYNIQGEEAWTTSKTYTNQFKVDITEKKYNNVITVKTNDNSLCIVYYAKNGSKYNIYFDLYNLYGDLLCNNKVLETNLSDIPKVSVFISETYLYLISDIKNNNEIKTFDRFGNDITYTPVILQIEPTISAKPYYIKDIVFADDNWVSLIYSNNKYYIQINDYSGAYKNEYVLLKKGTKNIKPTLFSIINGSDNFGIISGKELYTIDKETLSIITLIKSFDTETKYIKQNSKTQMFCIVCEHEFEPEGSSAPIILNTDVYQFNKDFMLIAMNQTRHSINDISIDSNDSIYIITNNNKITKYKMSMTYSNEGVIANKCIKFNGGNSRIKIDNPFYNKTTEKPIDLTTTGFSVSLWYKPNTFDWNQQVILGGIVLPEWQDLQYCKYWNKFFMIAENTNMLAVGGYEPDDDNLVWRAYNISDLEYNIHSFIWVDDIRRFVAVGKDSNQYYVSENGLEWLIYKLPDEDIRLNKVKYNKEQKRLYFMGDKYLSYADNFYFEPEKITAVTNIPQYNIIDIDYANNMYVLLADDSSLIYYNKNGLNEKWDNQRTGLQVPYNSVNVGYYKNEKCFIVTPSSGKYLYKLMPSDTIFTLFEMPDNYEEIRKVRVIEDKFYIIPDKNYCLTINDDGTWNTTDIVFGSNNIADDIMMGELCTEYDWDEPELFTVTWKTPIKYIVAPIDNSNFVLADWATGTGLDIPKPYNFKKTYFVNAKRLNIWKNFEGTWESYSDRLAETWRTLALHDKSTNIITDFAMVIGYNRHLYLVYDNQKFKSNFVFDGSKLNNWYNFIVIANGINHTFTLYVNGEEYNVFEYDPNGSLKLTYETMTLGDINKHKGSERNIIEEKSFWDYNYYSLYGCMNDLRLYNHQLTQLERDNITQINVGTYNGVIYEDNLPIDTSEFNNNLKTDDLYCINKDWSMVFTYKNSSVLDKLVFDKADEYGGLMLGFFDGSEIIDTIWLNIISKWKVINEEWKKYRITNTTTAKDNELYMLIFDKRNNRDFRLISFLPEGSYVTGQAKYTNTGVLDPHKLKAETTDKTKLYNKVLYRFNKINLSEPHKYGLSYNHTDRMVKVYFDGQLTRRLFNLEYNNSELPISVTDSNKIHTFSDLKIYHSCLSENMMKSLTKNI